MKHHKCSHLDVIKTVISQTPKIHCTLRCKKSHQLNTNRKPFENQKSMNCNPFRKKSALQLAVYSQGCLTFSFSMQINGQPIPPEVPPSIPLDLKFQKQLSLTNLIKNGAYIKLLLKRMLYLPSSVFLRLRTLLVNDSPNGLSGTGISFPTAARGQLEREREREIAISQSAKGISGRSRQMYD